MLSCIRLRFDSTGKPLMRSNEIAEWVILRVSETL